MIEVQMSKDVRDCAPKILGPLTARQIVTILIGLAYGVPLYFIFGSFISDVFIRVVICLVLMAPTLACGWVDLYGMHLEQFFLHVIKTLRDKPAKRMVDVENNYEIEKEDVDLNSDKPPERVSIGFFEPIQYSRKYRPIR